MFITQNYFVQHMNITIGLYQPLDGVINLKYKLLCFLTPNKKFQ